jgi:hypothetical protein
MPKERNSQVSNAVGRPAALPEDETAWMIVESREKPQRDILAIKYAAKERGREAAQLVFARKPLRMGRPLGEIMEAAEFPEAEILALRVSNTIAGAFGQAVFRKPN